MKNSTPNTQSDGFSGNAQEESGLMQCQEREAEPRPPFQPESSAGATSQISSRLCQSELLARGWTRGAIERLLGEPDTLEDNPKYRYAGAPMRIYYGARVEAAEATEEFRSLRAQAEKRKAAGRKAAQTRREKTQDFVRKLNIEVPRMTLPDLRRRAVEHYNAISSSFASLDSDDEFLDRISYNYLRHACSGYEATIARLSGRTGKGEALEDYRDRLLDAVVEVYPHLTTAALAYNDKKRRETWGSMW